MQLLSYALAPAPAAPAPDAVRDLAQLRHHTKNAWQRVLCEIWKAGERHDSPAFRQLAAELEQRIRHATAISDALFGFTRQLQPFEARLGELAEHVRALLADGNQAIHLDVSCTGECPAPLQSLVLKVAQEMVCNAVKHGLYARAQGCIRVEFRFSASHGLSLRVADDGWGFPEPAQDGEGLPMMRDLAALYGGRVRLSRNEGWTVAALTVA
ncbi:hypothetical protein QMO56_10440 [Roseomonas sp. E05]|uniref:ATP-binding protein n=1 Tax=Roseomonas sp. E05 TaxID=3046310 RepID=UPI0024B9B2E7|nr:ATP-binding protein [Roseomonas sp. E05]MDJ0388529.1 hypothetical protein [Roseomonas sp. E05]